MKHLNTQFLFFLFLIFTSCVSGDPNINFEDTNIPRLCQGNSIADYQVYFNKSQQEEWRNFECGCNNEASIEFWFEHREIFHEAQKCLNMTESCFGDEAIGSYYSEIIATSGRVDRSNPNNPIRVDCDQDGVSFCQASLSFTIQIPTLNLESLQQKINSCLQEDYNLQNFEYQQDLLLSPERLCLGEDIDCVDLVGLDDENEVARVENDDHWPQLSRCTQIAIRTSYAEAVRSLYESNGFEGASLNNYDPDDDRTCSLLDSCPYNFDLGEDEDEDGIIDACDECLSDDQGRCRENIENRCQLCPSNDEAGRNLDQNCLFSISPPQNLPQGNLFDPAVVQNDYMTIGDFNNDRKKDFVAFVSVYQKAYFFSDFFRKFTSGQSLNFMNADLVIDFSELGRIIPNSISSGDYNHDGIDDLLLGHTYFDEHGAFIVIAGGQVDDNNEQIYFKEKRNIQEQPFVLNLNDNLIENNQTLRQNHLYLFTSIPYEEDLPIDIGTQPVINVGPIYPGDIPYSIVRNNSSSIAVLFPQNFFTNDNRILNYFDHIRYLQNLNIPRASFIRHEGFQIFNQFSSVNAGDLLGNNRIDFIFGGTSQHIILLNNDKPLKPIYNLSDENGIIDNALLIDIPSLESRGWSVGVSDVNSDGSEEFFIANPDWQSLQDGRGRVIFTHNQDIQNNNANIPFGASIDIDIFINNTNSKQIQSSVNNTFLADRGFAIFSNYIPNRGDDAHYFAPANLGLAPGQGGSVFGYCNGINNNINEPVVFIGDEPDVRISSDEISFGWNLNSYSSGNNRRCLFFTDLQGRIWGRCESDPYRNEE